MFFKFPVRTVLGLCVIFSFRILSKTLEKTFGSRWLQWFLAITVTQSHFMFYLSRPLPNVFALPLGEKVLQPFQTHQENFIYYFISVLLALDGWLKNDNKQFLLFSGAAIIIFRFEVAMYLGLLLIYDMYHKRISVKE